MKNTNIIEKPQIAKLKYSFEYKGQIFKFNNFKMGPFRRWMKDQESDNLRIRFESTIEFIGKVCVFPDFEKLQDFVDDLEFPDEIEDFAVAFAKMIGDMQKK